MASAPARLLKLTRRNSPPTSLNQLHQFPAVSVHGALGQPRINATVFAGEPAHQCDAGMDALQVHAVVIHGVRDMRPAHEVMHEGKP